jgi:predicted RNase H-like nuclease (RuvC/YqgF family)
MTTLQKTVLAGVYVATVGVGFYEARHAAQLRHEVQMLQQQQAPLAGQVEQLTRERDGATNKLAVMRDENERLNGNTVEVLKLRGMVSTLRRELESQKTAAAKDRTNLTETTLAAHKPGGYISKAQLTDAGFKTPEAALQTYFQAMLSGDYNHIVAAMSAQSGASNSDQREAFEKGFREHEEVSRFQGIQMLGKKVIAEGRVDVGFLIYEEGKAPMLHIQQLVKEGGEWKAGNSLGVDSSWGEGGQIQPLTPPANQ